MKYSSRATDAEFANVSLRGQNRAKFRRHDSGFGHLVTEATTTFYFTLLIYASRGVNPDNIPSCFQPRNANHVDPIPGERADDLCELAYRKTAYRGRS